jgi:hypothetical protein
METILILRDDCGIVAVSALIKGLDGAEDLKSQEINGMLFLILNVAPASFNAKADEIRKVWQTWWVKNKIMILGQVKDLGVTE